MESQLQTKASGDDEIMLALNKKVAEWKVQLTNASTKQPRLF